MQTRQLVGMIFPPCLDFLTPWIEQEIQKKLEFKDHTLVNPNTPLDSDFTCGVFYKTWYVGTFSYERGIVRGTEQYWSAEKMLLDILWLHFTGKERDESDGTFGFIDNPLG